MIDLRTCAAVLAIAMLAGGCGSDEGGSTAATDSDFGVMTFTGDGSDDFRAELHVTRFVKLDSGELQKQTSFTIDCPGSDACPDIENDLSMFDPLPDGVACTEIYGGPDVAKVTGTVNGEEIETQYSRENGCEIGRWDKAQPVVGEPSRKLVQPPGAPQ